MTTERTSRSDIQRLLVSGASDAAVCDAFTRFETSPNGPVQAAVRFAVAGFVCANRPHLAEHVLRIPIELLHHECRIDNPRWFTHAADWVAEEWDAYAGPNGVKWMREELPKLMPLLERLLWQGAAQHHLYPPGFYGSSMTEKLWGTTRNPGWLLEYLWQLRSLSLREHTASAAVSLRASARLFPSPDAFRYVTDVFDAKLITGVDRKLGNRPDNLPESLRAVRQNLNANEYRTIADGLRDIFGNPFRPMAFDSAWRTSDVMLLARGIHDESAFDRTPILADALQDAGCDNDDVLTHCRDTSLAHVRGCWVIDRLLGLE